MTLRTHAPPLVLAMCALGLSLAAAEPIAAAQSQSANGRAPLAGQNDTLRYGKAAATREIEALPVTGKNQLKKEIFPLSDVKLLDGPFARQQERNRQYLLKLDPDRLLSWFRSEAGLDPKAPPYRGWESESPNLTGHILGFYMSGTAMMVQATGDETLRGRLEYVIEQLAEVQAAHGSGYLLSIHDGKKFFAEVAAGHIHIAGLPWNGNTINGLFEPTYTFNKLTLGLYQVYLATASEKAKQVLCRACDWIGHDVLDKLTDAQVQQLLGCEHGSIHESFVNAYALTGDARFLRWARRLCEDRFLEPLAKGNVDFLTGYHANSNIPKFTGFEQVYQVTAESKLHAAAINFWNDVVQRRSWVIGGNSANELFFDPGRFEQALHAVAGPETCNSVNMLRLTESLFRSEPSTAMLDFYERTLWNHILAVHDPERGMFNYYVPMQPGSYRVYSDEFDSMWCCVGTGLECPGKYGQMIFSRSPNDNAVDVNLFIASELRWSSRDVVLRQETSFPDEPRTSVGVKTKKPTTFTLRVRHPWWVSEGAMRLGVNGESVASPSQPSTYVEIHREWHDGDRVTIELPMHLAAETLPGDRRYVALLYGPIVLSGELGREGLSKLDFWQTATTAPRRPIPEADVPAFVAGSPEALLAGVKPVEGQPLVFSAHGISKPREVRLIPFFRNHFQRYAIYFRHYSPTEYETFQEVVRKEATLDRRTVDRVKVGDPGSEAVHQFQGQLTNTGHGAYGEHMETRWRNAQPGGWFHYVLKVTPDQPLSLQCTYWGGERGQRTFDILADGVKLATTSLTDTGKAEFYTVETPLPPKMLEGKSAITVKFQPHPGNMAGGVFDIRTVAPENKERKTP